MKNISSQTLTAASVKDKILKFHALSKEKFKSFQSAVYVKRDTLISATIHKFDLPPINHALITKAKDSKEVKMSKKEIKEAKRLVKTGADRAGGEGCILKYDITPFSPLFERQHMVGVQRKSQLVTELEEAYLSAEHYQDIDRVPVTTCVVVDFMSFQRSSVIEALMNTDFGKLVNSQMSKMLSSYPNTLLHIVFDSYVSKSLKGSERERRAGDTLELAKIDAKTKVPAQMEKFWGSSSNKVTLQSFFAENALEIARENNINIVLSGTVIDDNVQPCRAIINREEYNLS